MSDMWDVKRVAQFLGKTEKAVRNMVDRKKLPYVKLGSGRRGSVMFCPEDIYSFIQARTIYPTEDKDF